jgi:hypothetical protein
MFFHEMPAANWDRVPVGDAKERYSLLDMSDGSVNLEDQFGEEPEYFFVHRGDVTIDGGVLLKDDFAPEISTLYVIDGDLKVNGAVSLQNGDSNTSLHVTGSVFVERLVCMWHAQLFVSGSLMIKDLLVTGLSDAGHLVVHGSVAARAWVDVYGRGATYFGAPPGARLVGNPGNGPGAGAVAERVQEAVRADLFDSHGYPYSEGIAKAAFEGRPVFR